VANYRTIKRLSDSHAAYIAGLVDGEGTITLTRRHRNENRQICLAISSTERNMLEFVRTATGIGKITSKKTTQDHHNTGYTYYISNRQALGLIEQIYPYLMSYKKQRAALVLKNYIRLTPRNGKYTPELLKQRNEFARKVLALKAND
jgi:hypothetical protein